ncbi:MAG: type II toxin-antitoxin system MqsA family antitoxin [Anaerolineales bacterium]
MMCIICDEAETLPGLTSVLLEREEHSLTFNNVPAQICPKCGEAYTDEAVTLSLLREAEKMARAGTKLEELEYALIAV